MRRTISRLVRRLVRGVRSSWDGVEHQAGAGIRATASSAPSSRLKARRSRPSSSGPPGSRRSETSVVRAMSSMAAVRSLSGPTAAREASQPSRAARVKRRQRDEQQGEAEVAELVVDAREGWATWSAPLVEARKPSPLTGGRRRRHVLAVLVAADL